MKTTEPKTPRTLHCVICAQPISPERLLRRAVTCSKEHMQILKNERRLLRDRGQGRCRLCGRPSSDEERGLYKAWLQTRPQPKRGRPLNASKKTDG